MQSFTITSMDSLRQLWPVMKTLIGDFLQLGAVVISIGKEGRTAAQNRLMWPLLEDVSNQATLNNEELSASEWKCVMMSSFLKLHKGVEPKLRLGLENEIVMLNYSTRDLSKKDFSALIEIIYAAGVMRGVKFTDKSMAVYEEWAKAS